MARMPGLVSALQRIRSRKEVVGYGFEQVASLFISNNGWFWWLVRATPGINKLVNRFFIDYITTRAPCRPTGMSLWGPGGNPPGECADYVSWTSLVDRTYSGRHLPAASAAQTADLPPPALLQDLFVRGASMAPCPKSTALFCFFAQWFTDSFLRTLGSDFRRNTSNHEIDLCQIYGLVEGDTHLLRRRDGSGKLKSQRLATMSANESEVLDEEYPRWLFAPDGLSVVEEFRGLSYINDAGTDYRDPAVLPEPFNKPTRKANLFVAGLERGNSTIFYSAINTIFLREHNRLCDVLARDHRGWNDDRLFETARNINIAQLLKVIVEDYINHISPAQFKVFFELGFAERRPWYRTNRIAAEFNLLYRWHSLVPDSITVKGRPMPDTDFRFNDRFMVERLGLDGVLDAASTQSAGRISLQNTASFLKPAELAALVKGRGWRLQGYNAYRKRFKLPRLVSFKELCGDDDLLAAHLHHFYGHIDKVDLVVGLLAERTHGQDAVLGNLMSYMVGVDAFSQALTNPLLARNVFGTDTFTAAGLRTVQETHSFAEIVERNLTKPKQARITFTIDAARPPADFRWPLAGKAQDIYNLLRMFLHWEEFFVKARARHASTIFKLNLFQPTVALLDHVAISSLFESRDFVQDYGFSWARPPRKLVGTTPSIFEAGASHDWPKAFYLKLLAHRQPAFLPTFQRVFGDFLERWIEMPKPFSMAAELERFAAAFVTEWLLGAPFDPDKIRLIYPNIFSHVAPWLTGLFPGSVYSRSRVAHREWVQFIRDTPEFEATLFPMAKDEGLAGRDAVADQLAFLVGMNSFLGTQNLLKSVVAELALHPEWRESIRSGAVASAPMPRIDMVLLETLRLHPPVTFIFGRANRSRPLESKSGTFRIEHGQLLMGVLPFAQRDPDLFPDPDAFRPERYLDPSAANGLVWSRGYQSGKPSERNRTCAGKDEGVAIARAFALTLLANAEWDFVSPPTWSRDRFDLNIAAPVGDMAVSRFARVGPRASAPHGCDPAEIQRARPG